MRRLSLAAVALYGLAGGCLCGDIPNLSANLDAGAETSSASSGGGTSNGSTGATTAASSSTSGSSSGGGTAASTSTGGTTESAAGGSGGSGSTGTSTSGATGSSTGSGTTGAITAGSSSGGSTGSGSSSGGLPTWTACKAPQPFAIDADPAAWAGIPSLLVPYSDAIVAPTSPVAPGSNAQLSAQVQAAWDAANLYLFVQVTDPVVVQFPDVFPDLFEEDSVEVYLDGRDSRLPAYDAGDWELTVSAFGQAAAGQDTGVVDDAGVFSHASASTAFGYAVEYGVPWTLILGNDGGAIGFDVAVNGNDGGGPWRLSQIMWSGDGGAYFDPQQFGQLVLGQGACGADAG